MEIVGLRRVSDPLIFIISGDSEADICLRDVLRKIYNCGWSDEQILEKRPFTDGGLI